MVPSVDHRLVFTHFLRSRAAKKRLVEAHFLERRSVPGLDVRRLGPLRELPRKPLVVDPEFRPRQGVVIGPAIAADARARSREALGLARIRPFGRIGASAPDESLIDVPGAVAVLL